MTSTDFVTTAERHALRRLATQERAKCLAYLVNVMCSTIGAMVSGAMSRRAALFARPTIAAK